MRDAFSNYHPIVNLTYFLMVLGCASFLRHPVCLGIALISSTIYASVLTGKENLARIVKGMLPMSVMIIIINPLVNHQGVTILGYFRSGNPFTLEACVYGFAAAAIIWSLVQWFVCWNRIMTTEKLIYLFGRIMPALSLVVSMSLRFVPRYQRQLVKAEYPGIVDHDDLGNRTCGRNCAVYERAGVWSPGADGILYLSVAEPGYPDAYT